jgi:hypothetical protein
LVVYIIYINDARSSKYQISIKAVEKIKTHICCSVTPFAENRAVYEIMYKKCGRATLATGFARWLPKTEETHSEYVIRIPFPLQQWLCESDSILYYVYTACIVWKLQYATGIR